MSDRPNYDDGLDPMAIYPDMVGNTLAASKELCALRNRVAWYARCGWLSKEDLGVIEARALENRRRP